MNSRGEACLKFNVCNCGDLVNVFIEKTSKYRAFTHSVDPGETSHNATSHQGLCYCHVTVDNIKPYMDQDLFYFVN